MNIPDFYLCYHQMKFSPQGRFTMAAKHHTSTAEIYENNIMDLEKVSFYNILNLFFFLAVLIFCLVGQ